MAFKGHPHPNPQEQRAHLPNRVFGADRAKKAALDFIEEIILSDQPYSFMENLHLLATDAAAARKCHHEQEEAEVGTANCAICLHNWTFDFGSELWQWFKTEYGYLFDDTRGKKDLIRDLRAEILQLKELNTNQADKIADLEYALAVERGCTEMSAEEVMQYRVNTQRQNPSSIWHKNRELDHSLTLMENSRDHWKQAYKEAITTANNAFSKLKQSETALQITKGEHGPLINALINLTMEVEMLSASVGGMALRKEREDMGGDEVFLTHTVGAKGTLDRYIIDPSLRENMAIIRTEKFAVGSGESHVIVRGSYGSPKAPWGELPLKSRHIIASNQDMEELSTQMNKLAQMVRQGHGHGGATSSPSTFERNWPKRPRLQSVVVVPPTTQFPSPQNVRPLHPPTRARVQPRAAPPSLPPLPPLPRDPPPRASATSAAGTYRGDSAELDTTNDIDISVD